MSAQTWQEKRTRLLKAACQRCADLVGAGMELQKATADVVRRFHGRSLGHGKILHLRRSTFYSYWYRWKKTSDASVFARKESAPRFNNDTGLQAWMVGYFALNEGITVRQAYRRLSMMLGPMPASYRTILRRLENEPLRRHAAVIRNLKTADVRRADARIATQEALNKAAAVCARGRAVAPAVKATARKS